MGALDELLMPAAFGTGSPAETAQQPSGLASLLFGLYNSAGNLAKRSFGASEEMRRGGAYNAGPVLEAAMLPMGTGAIAGVPMRAGEAVLGAGPIRAYHGSPNANIPSFDRPAYFTPDRAYAEKFAQPGGKVYEADISPRKPYYTSNEALVEQLRSFPERADELRKAGYDAVILSGSDKAMEPILGLGGYKQPQIYTLDPSIAAYSGGGGASRHLPVGTPLESKF